jgi:hypothetical protein
MRSPQLTQWRYCVCVSRRAANVEGCELNREESLGALSQQDGAQHEGERPGGSSTRIERKRGLAGNKEIEVKDSRKTLH